MSAAVCAISSTSALESIIMQPAQVIPEITNPPHVDMLKETEEAPEQFDVWASIQDQKSKLAEPKKQEPYTLPIMRQSSSLLSQKSLETCTESLCSETGSENFLSSDHEANFFPSKKENRRNLLDKQLHGLKKMSTVNSHCSSNKRSSLPRSFPPPLSSILQQDGPHMQMRTQRRDGRLVVDAVSIPSQNCFHAERHNGRLLLSFSNTSSTKTNTETEAEMEVEDEEQVEEIEQEQEEIIEEAIIEEEEEEVEVVDRGTIVEVKVSTQPQQMAGKAASKKVHRSSIVINKFVSCTAVENVEKHDAEIMPPISGSTQMKRSSATTTTAAAAAVAASSVSENISADEGNSSADNKLLFTSKKKNKEELLHDIKRCSELRKPLFIWEPCCIATST